MIFLNETPRQISFGTGITLENEGTIPFPQYFLHFFKKMKPHTLIQTYNYKLLIKVRSSDTSYLSFYFCIIKEVKTD